MKIGQKRNAQRGSPKSRTARIAAVLLSIALTLAVIASSALSVLTVLIGTYVSRHPERFTVDLTLLQTARIAAPPTLYYPADPQKSPTADGNAIPLYDTSEDVPRALPLSEIPDHLRNAFVAIEDKRFYSHVGIDVRRTLSAALLYLSGNRSGFGGSTITQQLVKNLTGESARTPARKLTELFRAIDLEKRLAKEEILEAYLNVVPLANGCIGVSMGAQYYFKKTPMELTLAECASLAAITQSPSRYDPAKHPTENKKRRDLILSEMERQGYITEALRREAAATEVETAEDTVPPRHVQSWYEDLVTEDVIRDLSEAYGYTRAEASRLYYSGGLRIYTLMDPTLQRAVEAYYRDPSHFPRTENGHAPQSAMIVLDPETGAILALAGAIGEKSGDRLFSFATNAKRPPGSVLKPISIYAPALEQGRITAASVYDDVPVRFEQTKGGTLRPWPKNASTVYRGLTSVDYAVRNSLNTVPIHILSELGLDNAFHYARDVLGIKSLEKGSGANPLDYCPAALALGQMTNGATLREITAAYTAFANRGIYQSARSYSLVTDRDGAVLLSNPTVVRRALSEENAAVMTKLLEGVTKNGTARSLTLTERTAVAGKTGTTQYSFDRWFIGYTPGLLAGVWYGCEYPESLSGIKGNPALGIFDGVMSELITLRPSKKQFDDSALRPVRVCADSGLLTTDVCTKDPRGDRTTVAYFTESTVPKRFCTCHTPIPYVGTGQNEADGVRVDPTDPRSAHTVGLLRVSRRFPMEVFVTDAQYTAVEGALTAPSEHDKSRPYYESLLPENTYGGKSYTAMPFNRAAAPIAG